MESGTLLRQASSGRVHLAMPRQARLEAPRALRHVMVLDWERRAIFRKNADPEDLVGRLAALAKASALSVLAWACVANPARLVRTDTRPLAPVLGVRPQVVYQAMMRGLEVQAEWDPFLNRNLPFLATSSILSSPNLFPRHDPLGGLPIDSGSAKSGAVLSWTNRAAR